MSDETWCPVADKDSIRARAELLKALRLFFEQREVLEVETPLLSHSAGTDPQLEPISASYGVHPTEAGQTLYLQTSPEFAMKRLLASGFGAIFQISKAFRNGESGPRHNPEFTLLEWYRPGFDEIRLMDEVKELVQTVYPAGNWQRLSYGELFEQYLGLDPYLSDAQTLAKYAKDNIETGIEDLNKDTWLDFLFSHLIEPKLIDPVFIHDYPASQAALARTQKNSRGIEIARRFELVIGGMEIANGYFELCDPEEQRSRFSREQEFARQNLRQERPVDENFLTALEYGLPDCAGVALGIDRLLMLICGAESIDEVLTFPLDRA